MLGSGLGDFAKAVEGAVAIPYSELEGFPAPASRAMPASLIVGRIGGAPVAVMAGRGHYYEHGRADVMRPALETLKALGVGDLILTNAAGSLRQDLPPGARHADHRPHQLRQAQPADRRGERRPLRRHERGLRSRRCDAPRSTAADEEGIELHQGVYMWFSGPSFETPAEIRAARILGADAVGMSTVPEVILARFLGLRVLAFSVVTNYGAGHDRRASSRMRRRRRSRRWAARSLRRILKRLLAVAT